MALLHPITPYITEEIWSHLKEESDDLLIVQDYPEFNESLIYQDDQEQMNKFIDVVTTIRNLRASVNIKPKDEVRVELFSDDDALIEYFKKSSSEFKDLARVVTLEVNKKDAKRPGKSIMGATTHTEVFLPLEGVIDLADQISRLQKELKKVEKEFTKYDKKLNNEKFMSNAPDEVVVEVREKHNEFEGKLKSIQDNLENFKS